MLSTSTLMYKTEQFVCFVGLLLEIIYNIILLENIFFRWIVYLLRKAIGYNASGYN